MMIFEGKNTNPLTPEKDHYMNCHVPIICMSQEFERLRGGHLVEISAVEEPNLTGSAHRRIGAEKFRRRNAIDKDVDRVVHDARGLVHQKALLRDRGLIIRGNEYLKALFACLVLKPQRD